MLDRESASTASTSILLSSILLDSEMIALGLRKTEGVGVRNLVEWPGAGL